MPAVTARRARRGFTLIEILVSLAMLGVVAGAILSVVVRQQRFYGSAAQMIEMRDNLRTVASVLPSELRAVAPREGDLTPALGAALTDSALDFRATIGVSVLCARASASDIVIPPYGANGDAGLTAWVSQPAVGDSLWIFKPGDPMATPVVPDSLIPYRITAITSGTCPSTSGFTTAAEAGSSVRYTLDKNLRPASEIPLGMPIRFLRRVRYSLYRSATDSKWYLGYRDHNPARASPWSAIQPVAGPLVPYATGGKGGLAITYLDADGVPVTAVANAPTIRRVELMIRAETSGQIRAEGFKRTATGQYSDSLSISVALRNR